LKPLTESKALRTQQKKPKLLPNYLARAGWTWLNSLRWVQTVSKHR